MATMKTLNGYGFNATEFDGKTSDSYMTVAQFVNKIYPVGSIYMSARSTSPAALFGGTWEQLQDRFLLAAGSTYSAGSTGGEATHTLTINEIPAHRHNHPNGAHTFGWANTSANNYIRADMSSTGSASNPSTFAGDNNFTNYAGGGGAHNNMPPYLVVYMWKRVS